MHQIEYMGHKELQMDVSVNSAICPSVGPRWIPSYPLLATGERGDQ